MLQKKFPEFFEKGWVIIRENASEIIADGPYGKCMMYPYMFDKKLFPTLKHAIDKKKFVKLYCGDNGIVVVDVKDNGIIHIQTEFGVCWTYLSKVRDGDYKTISNAVNKEEFLSKHLKKEFGHTYKFNRHSYKGLDTIITAHCSTHGAFNIDTSELLKGGCCPKCVPINYTLKDWLRVGSKGYFNIYSDYTANLTTTKQDNTVYHKESTDLLLLWEMCYNFVNNGSVEALSNEFYAPKHPKIGDIVCYKGEFFVMVKRINKWRHKEPYTLHYKKASKDHINVVDEVVVAEKLSSSVFDKDREHSCVVNRLHSNGFLRIGERDYNRKISDEW